MYSRCGSTSTIGCSFTPGAGRVARVPSQIERRIVHFPSRLEAVPAGERQRVRQGPGTKPADTQRGEISRRLGQQRLPMPRAGSGWTCSRLTPPTFATEVAERTADTQPTTRSSTSATNAVQLLRRRFADHLPGGLDPTYQVRKYGARSATTPVASSGRAVRIRIRPPSVRRRRPRPRRAGRGSRAPPRRAGCWVDLVAEESRTTSQTVTRSVRWDDAT